MRRAKHMLSSRVRRLERLRRSAILGALLVTAARSDLYAQVRATPLGISRVSTQSQTQNAATTEERSDHRANYMLIGGGVGLGVGLAVAGIYVSRSDAPSK